MKINFGGKQNTISLATFLAGIVQHAYSGNFSSKAAVKPNITISHSTYWHTNPNIRFQAVAISYTCLQLIDCILRYSYKRIEIRLQWSSCQEANFNKVLDDWCTNKHGYLLLVKGYDNISLAIMIANNNNNNDDRITEKN